MYKIKSNFRKTIVLVFFGMCLVPNVWAMKFPLRGLFYRYSEKHQVPHRLRLEIDIDFGGGGSLNDIIIKQAEKEYCIPAKWCTFSSSHENELNVKLPDGSDDLFNAIVNIDKPNDIGIVKEKLPKLFEAYQKISQLKDSTGKKDEKKSDAASGENTAGGNS